MTSTSLAYGGKKRETIKKRERISRRNPDRRGGEAEELQRAGRWRVVPDRRGGCAGGADRQPV